MNQNYTFRQNVKYRDIFTKKSISVLRMTKENADPENPKKSLKRSAWPRPEFPEYLGSVPQSLEKLGAVPAKTSKTLSSKARWPGIIVIQASSRALRPPFWSSRLLVTS